MNLETRIYAYREHHQGESKDFIAVRTTDGVFYVNLEREKVEAALHEFETGEEVNFNY